MTILQALAEVLHEWSGAPDYKLQDDQWHVSQMYTQQKQAIKDLSPDETSCGKYGDVHNVSYFCTIPFKVSSH
jgi:hypothetical protein